MEKDNSKPLSTIFPKDTWQFTDAKEKRPVESHDHQYSEGSWHFFKFKFKFKFILISSYIQTVSIFIFKKRINQNPRSLFKFIYTLFRI